MTDDGNEEGYGSNLVSLPALRRVKTLLKHLPQIRANWAKVTARLFGSPERTRRMAGAEATAEITREAQEAHAVILRAAAERTARQVTGGADPELAMRAVARLGEDAVRAQMNVEQTLSKAVDEAPLIIEQIDAEHEVSDDWITRWIRLAETASDEYIQRLFGRILVGEVCRPGRFSPITLHMLSVMTPSLANIFERLCNLTIAGLDSCPVVILVDEMGESPPLGKFGLTYDDLLNLQSSGLITSITIAGFNFPEDVSNAQFEYAGKRARIEARKGTLSGEVPVIPLSQAASEIRELIALQPNDTYTAALTSTLDKMKLNFLVSEEGGMSTVGGKEQT